MSFLQKIFGTSQVQQQQPTAAQAQQIPGNNPMNNPAPAQPLQSAKTEPNGVIPGDGQTPGNNVEVSPIEEYKNLWEPTPTDPNAPDPNANVITSEALMTAAGKVDFAQAISQETLAKITAGGPEATQALIESLNKVAQLSFGQSMAAAQKLVDRKVSEAEKKFSTHVPTMLKGQNVRESLLAKNPALAHPSVIPVVDAIRSQLQEKYPKATETELQTHAEKIFLGMGEAFKPAPKKVEATVPADEDWSDLN